MQEIVGHYFDGKDSYVIYRDENGNTKLVLEPSEEEQLDPETQEYVDSLKDKI